MLQLAALMPPQVKLSLVFIMETNFWLQAERTNGRLAMLGLFAVIINYGFFGWIIPGIY